MPRYRVEFTEEVTYTVEFDASEPIVDEGNDEWWQALERDFPDWFKFDENAESSKGNTATVAVHERDLVKLTEL